MVDKIRMNSFSIFFEAVSWKRKKTKIVEKLLCTIDFCYYILWEIFAPNSRLSTEYSKLKQMSILGMMYHL